MVVLVLVLDLYPESKYIFPCYQSLLMNSCLLQKFVHLCLIQCKEMKNLNVSGCYSPCVGPLPRIKIYFSCYQSLLMNSCLLQKFVHFCLIQCKEMKNLHVYIIQFHIQKIHTCQCQHF